jgi:hypothetical protein
MIPVSMSWQRTPSKRNVCVAVLAVMCAAWQPNTLGAGQGISPAMSDVQCPMSEVKTTDIGRGTSDIGLLFAASFVNDILGNRTRMIQVGCIVLAIGVFVLRQKYR